MIKIACQINQKFVSVSKKIFATVQNPSTNEQIVGNDFLSLLYNLFYLRFCDSSDQ